jgi:hypothetical protein
MVLIAEPPICVSLESQVDSYQIDNINDVLSA